ncbi:MAG TPA: glucoamylase family protein [Pyrinomonadaceae bacterium]|nr:glucoamylase family protein [Pyrinomonadaceae bacterium]
MSDEALAQLQHDTFGYFLKETNPDNGLVPDSTRQGAPSSITAVGLGLSAYTVGVERGYLMRAKAIERVLTTLRFFWNSPQEEEQDAISYKGFFYHFLDMQTGRRAQGSEVSTIDTTFLLAGALAAAQYFNRETKGEREIRRLADALYHRANWQWALNGGVKVSHGWKPERGFLKYRWEGYSEALLLYILGLGSPTYPLPEKSYKPWAKTYRWRKLYDIEFLYAGPLFIHQLPHVWIDFRGIQDEFMRARGIDYFENSRRATYVQQQYAIRNPRKFKGYNENCWGITASDGPGPAIRKVDGVKRRFYDYRARSIPYGPDDGTLAPWAAIASLPFAPEIVLPALQHLNDVYPEMTSKYGLKCSFNPTYSGSKQTKRGWISQGYYGLDQGPIVLMIENYRSGFFWRLTRHCPYLVTGLRRAGFTGGWLIA